MISNNPGAVAAARKAYADRKANLTMMDIHQGPGEGNYERIEDLAMEAALDAAEAWRAGGLDEQDTLVLKHPPSSEGESE